jgi:hypothetical protein
MTKKQIKKLDDTWSAKIKLKGYCEHCKKTIKLNAHHVFSRSNRSTRWDLENGICLCVGCHVFSSQFSAHKTPMEFAEWIKEYRGEEWYSYLLKRKNEAFEGFYDDILDDLENESAV